jgi:cellulose synthase (UDP-forming)
MILFMILYDTPAALSHRFINERLVFGMAPDDLQAALTQRLRWATGALQILARTNPLSVPGLSTAQAVLFWVRSSLARH